MPFIEGGYYIKARKIQESEISTAPPHVREIWDWLIKECNHKIGISSGRTIERGQCVRTIKDIQSGLHWLIGYCKKTYTKSQCEFALQWLRKRTMIETVKTTRGMVITIINYDSYQDPKNYEKPTNETTNETMDEQSADTINKNGKNEKNKELTKVQIDHNEDFIKKDTSMDELVAAFGGNKKKTIGKKELWDYANSYGLKLNWSQLGSLLRDNIPRDAMFILKKFREYLEANGHINKSDEDKIKLWYTKQKLKQLNMSFMKDYSPGSVFNA